MGFQVEPNIIEISDVPNLSSQISSIDAANDAVLLELDTKGAVVPETYKQYTLDLINNVYIAVTRNTDPQGYSTNPTVIIYNSLNPLLSYTTQTLPISKNWTSIQYAQGKFVIVGHNTNISLSSTNGINWIQSILPVSQNWNKVYYANNKFIAVPYSSSTAAYSTDGINWISINLPQSLYYTSIAYGSNKFVIVSQYTDKAFYSTDGITWSTATLPGSRNWNSVSYGNGKFVAISSGTSNNSSNLFAYSADGITWGQSEVNFGRWSSLVYASNKFVAISSEEQASLIHSSDGITWVSYTPPSGGSTWAHKIFYIDKFYAYKIGTYGKIYSSIDGITWTESSIYGAINDFSYGEITTTKTVAEILGVE